MNDVTQNGEPIPTNPSGEPVTPTPAPQPDPQTPWLNVQVRNDQNQIIGTTVIPDADPTKVEEVISGMHRYNYDLMQREAQARAESDYWKQQAQIGRTPTPATPAPANPNGVPAYHVPDLLRESLGEDAANELEQSQNEYLQSVINPLRGQLQSYEQQMQADSQRIQNERINSFVDNMAVTHPDLYVPRAVFDLAIQDPRHPDHSRAVNTRDAYNLYANMANMNMSHPWEAAHQVVVARTAKPAPANANGTMVNGVLKELGKKNAMLANQQQPPSKPFEGMTPEEQAVAKTDFWRGQPQQ